MKRCVLMIWFLGCVIPAMGKFIVCQAPASQTNPVVYDDKVFWIDARLKDHREVRDTDTVLNPSQIFFKRLPNGNDIRIFRETNSYLTIDDIWEEYLAYSTTSTLVGVFSLKTGDLVFLSNAIQPPVRIHNNIAVFAKFASGGTKHIYGYNLTTREEFPIVEVGNLCCPDIYNDIVVWFDGITVDSNSRMVISAKNLTTGEIFDVCTVPSRKYDLSIFGDKIVWSSDDGVYYFDINSRQKFCLAQNAWSPRLYGDVVVYRRSSGSSLNVFGFNFKTAKEFFISTLRSGYLGNVYEEIVVWSDRFSDDMPSDENLYGENIEKAQSESIGLGQVKIGSTVGNTGIDFTKQGYRDTVDTWYHFVPPADGDYIISTFGSDFDTTLAVFDEDYNEIEFNDNYNCKQSKLTLRAKAGVKYFIRIAGYDGQVGNYRLSVIQDGPEPLLSDLNLDGNVNAHDLAILASEWLKSIY